MTATINNNLHKFKDPEFIEKIKKVQLILLIVLETKIKNIFLLIFCEFW